MTYINVKGRDRFLYRAVDSTGQTIDFLLTDRRDAAAGQAKFIGTLLWDRRLIAMEPAAALAQPECLCNTTRESDEEICYKGLLTGVAVIERLLEVRNLAISYRARSGGPHRALTEVNLEIAPGRVLGLVGGSGSGKTTLALAILGLLPSNAHIDSGGIFFRGIDLLGAGDHALQRIRGAQISIIFQEPATALNPVLRVGEQIADVIAAHTACSRGQCREIAKERMRELQLCDVQTMYDAYPHELSGGQRQRIAIAQAFACRPALVVADEPTTALDSITQAGILRLIKHLVTTTGVAMILITHDPALLQNLADRMAVLDAGTLVEEGAFRDVCERPVHPYTASLLAECRKC